MDHLSNWLDDLAEEINKISISITELEKQLSHRKDDHFQISVIEELLDKFTIKSIFTMLEIVLYTIKKKDENICENDSSLMKFMNYIENNNAQSLKEKLIENPHIYKKISKNNDTFTVSGLDIEPEGVDINVFCSEYKDKNQTNYNTKNESIRLFLDEIIDTFKQTQ